ncbi:hypothetical protein [Candidatus Mesenet endosymbiont of Agriotes lineatus]|uniref:hypothetical protein n=1 Tax=Candidatus Mesenet endosymbiont of Agriotes lineatus TaxID=3077948 RepID=UPI0030D1F65C
MKYDEGRLWSVVIIQAIQDLLGKNQKLRKEAQGWINSQSFAMVCDLANLDFERTKNALNKIGTNKEGLIDFSSSEVKSLLIYNLDRLLSKNENKWVKSVAIFLTTHC